MIIVGSTALKYFGLNRRPPSDIDRWFSESEERCGKEDDHTIPDNIMDMMPQECGFATPDAIYTIKCSHFHWDIHWEKTKQDILWLKGKGCKLIPELYYKLKTHWVKGHGDKDFLSLMKGKKDFFTDMVEYKYDHDYLHELVAHPNPPMYTHCLKDGHEVLTDWGKFCNMPLEDQVRMIREEITVIATERWLLSSYWSGKIDWYRAYIFSVRKTLTRLMKGNFADFIVFNIDKLVKPDYSYFEHLFKTLEEEKLMSKVDTTIFEELAGKLEISTDRLIYQMCENDLFEDAEHPFDWPDQGSREYNDPTYRKEIQDYRDKVEEYFNGIMEEVGMKYQYLEQDGGGEGGSEYCYGVFKINDTIYKAEYSYYSHYGHEYDDITSTLREVKPVEKTITVYE